MPAGRPAATPATSDGSVLRERQDSFDAAATVNEGGEGHCPARREFEGEEPWVSLATVDTGSLLEHLEQAGTEIGRTRAFGSSDPFEDTVAVFRVVLRAGLGEALATPRLKSVLATSPRWECRRGLEMTAARALKRIGRADETRRMRPSSPTLAEPFVLICASASLALRAGFPRVRADVKLGDVLDLAARAACLPRFALDHGRPPVTVRVAATH